MSAPPKVWKATQRVTAVGKGTEGLQGALGELQKQGAILTEIHFDLTHETWAKPRHELTADAIRALRAEAERVADAMDMQISRYTTVQISEDNDQRSTPLRQVRFPQNGESLTMPSDTIEVAVTVSVRAALAPKASP